MHPLIGKKAFIKYDLAGFNVDFLNESALQIDGMFGNEKRTELVEYTSVMIDKNIYLVHWFEPISKVFVSQVQNFNNFKVYSNLLNLGTSEFFHMKGKITILQEPEDEPEDKDPVISKVKI